VPGEGNDVIIDRPSADVSVTFPSGTTSINSLLCRETLVIAGRAFGVSGIATIGGVMLVDGGTLTNTTLAAEKGTTVLVAPNSDHNHRGGVTVNGDLDLTGPGKVRNLNDLTLGATTGSWLMDTIARVDTAGETDIFIGGLGDYESGPVTDYKDALPSTSGRTVAYFRQNQVKEAIAFANANLHNGQALNIIAHSWGADAAVRVAKGVDGKVDNLVGIDPVGKPFKKLIGKCGSRPENVANVVTVYGQPSRRDTSDTGETVGKVVGGQPKAFKKQADITIRVDAHHTEFKNMLERKGPDGRSAKNIVDQSYDTKRK
jgi:hypothetical protein